MTTLYYFHDPMCSWCYAFEHNLNQIEASLPDSIRLIKIVGGLAADSNVVMPKALQNSIQAIWLQIEKTVPHVKFNFEFWNKNQPFRSTYPSCRAVLAAKKQSPAFEKKMIQQIQRAYYVNAENPSLDEILYLCAERAGLNRVRFLNDYTGTGIEAELQKEIQFTRQMGVSSFPSLRLDFNKKVFPIHIDYNNEQKIFEQISKYVGDYDESCNSK